MALDFGMALARGLVAPQKQLQDELKKLAGKTFKTEEWWNQQLDRQIQEGITEQKTRTETTYPGGMNQYGMPNRNPAPTFWDNYIGRQATTMYPSPITKTVNYTEQRNLSSTELSDIELQAKETGRKAKREATQAKKGKRGARGSSGLMGRSTTKDVGLSSGLPSLGSLGLGLGKSYLG
tara:strand:- start:298 stop:834 length:537 start_codon:yes stop_codon:yes gene_type:complete